MLVQCPECRESVSSVQAKYFSNGEEVWRLDTSSTTVASFPPPEVGVGVNEDWNRPPAAAVVVNAQIGTVNLQQLQIEQQEVGMQMPLSHPTEHSSLAPHPFAPLPRPQAEEAELEPHEVHMSGTTEYAVAEYAVVDGAEHITPAMPAMQMGGAPLPARAILETESAPGETLNGTTLENAILGAGMLSPQSFPNDQEAWRAGLRTRAGSERRGSVSQYSMLKSNMALRVRFFDLYLISWPRKVLVAASHGIGSSLLRNYGYCIFDVWSDFLVVILMANLAQGFRV